MVILTGHDHHALTMNLSVPLSLNTSGQRLEHPELDSQDRQDKGLQQEQHMETPRDGGNLVPLTPISNFLVS